MASRAPPLIFVAHVDYAFGTVFADVRTSSAMKGVPTFDVESLRAFVRDKYGVLATVNALDSERDQNFIIRADSGAEFVLKIANSAEERAFLEAQQAILAHAAPLCGLTPRVVPAVDGSGLVTINDAKGASHFAWAISRIPGDLLADVRYRSPELLTHFGRCIAELGIVLHGFDAAAARREFHWDLARARETVSARRALIRDAQLGIAIDTLVQRFSEFAAPLLGSLPRGVIHGDLNDRNVLVSRGTGVSTRHQQISGFIDFGDMVHSYRIADLAIAAAYMVLDADDPLAVIASLVRGHRHIRPVSADECAVLFGLIAMRLCLSACMAAEQRAAQPENAYLGISQDAIARTLPLLASIPFGLAKAVIREANGLEPVESSAAVRNFLMQSRDTIASIFATPLVDEMVSHVDLSIGSPLLSGNLSENDEQHLTPKLEALLRTEGTRVAAGGYDEARLIYASDSAECAKREQRMVHFGVDVYVPAGTPLHAPLDGVIKAFHDNANPRDYGPVVILEHVTDDGVPFHTLYGHLSRESIAGLEVGQHVHAGDKFATLGDASVNGGWTPHLHVQIITDLLELGTDFPGAARASQRAVWRSLSPDPNLLLGIHQLNKPSHEEPVPDAAAHRRRVSIGNLSIAYRNSVRTVRGWMQYLYDDVGRRYIDAYNNVPHVGHAHPRVVEAATAQMRVLNTNTRYLNDKLAEYAERLTATLPAELDTCVFVNSASEANELALRMARAFTGARDMIVLEAAYHGNTTTLIDISPYKHAGPGGQGAPDWVHVAPLPDGYRGCYKRGESKPSASYAEQVGNIINLLPNKLCGFIAETCPSVGGQIMLPEGYLADVYRHVRAAGGVCIADEVQTGLGRMGTRFWAFQAHHVVPDIVVMGKPLGNGHPLAAVVTTRAIADAFDNGMEYFSTFGGNNVSCAVGLAVLDVLRDEGLQAHALNVGAGMLEGLNALMSRHEIIGDVRGSGLFLGVELVRSRATLEPAGEEASYVANRMRDQGILLGTDGPYHNVVKIRPPMPFNSTDAERLVTVLDGTLAELNVV